MVTKAQKQADTWNDKYKFPTAVILTDDDNVEHETRTRSIAWVLCGHTVVEVDGRAGGYLLDRIRPKDSSYHKSDQAHIQVGEFSCHINKFGGVVNAPLITVWSKKNVEDYIKFLEQLLPYLDNEGEG